jgi:hypothetical protein
VIPIAAVIGAATAAGFGAEHRWRRSAEALAARLMWAPLCVLMPFVSFSTWRRSTCGLDRRLAASVIFWTWAIVVAVGVVVALL